MNWIVTALLAGILALAPLLAATPDEPLYSSLLCAAAMLALTLAVAADWRGSGGLFRQSKGPIAAFGLLLGWALLSVIGRLIAGHGIAYGGVMERGWLLLAADFAVFLLAARVAQERAMRSTLLLAASLSAASLADQGVSEYIPYLRTGQIYYRIYVTSTPDFLAGYFVQIIPLTLALFLTALSAKLSALLRGAFALLLALVLLFELTAMLTTGSRFALASLTVGLILFAASLWRAVRTGLPLSRTAQRLLIGVSVCTVLVGAIFARPVFMRLFVLHDQSFAFRLWTWRGALRMAMAHPLLGTGSGTWADLYPPYALTGFTRLAHNSYLQMTDECGIPALLLLLAALALAGTALWRRLASPACEDRLLLCGALAGLAAGVVQNLIDSDWYVFFLGATFWTMAGIGWGFIREDGSSETVMRPVPKPALAAIGIVSALLFWVALAQGVAAFYAGSAKQEQASSPTDAETNYRVAQTWDPLNARYFSDPGFQVYPRLADLPAAENALRRAVALEPNSVNYRRLGSVLQTEGRQAEAIAAYRSGLRAEPASLDLLLALARVSPMPQALGYYQSISDLETTPVGTVRAIGEIVETKFAVADAALADTVAKTDPAKAVSLYLRAQGTLEKFADEGGTTNIEREAIIGGHPDPQWDADMRVLYLHVMAARIRLAPGYQQAGLSRQKAAYEAKFDKVFADSSKAGNI